MIVEKDGMAWTGKVLSISPIDGADRIQKTEVICGKGGKWTGVTTKDVQVGNLVVVFLPDAVLPQIDVFSFMEKHHWRVKMCKLKGCPSEVLIMPMKELNTKIEFELSYLDAGDIEQNKITPMPIQGYDLPCGVDVTNQLRVRKYEKEIPAQISGQIYGAFPSFIPKTDEPNFQSVPEFRDALVGKEFYASEKYDGSSLTIYHKDGHIGVCSRNWEMKEDYNMAGWQIVKRYNLKEKLPPLGNIALQMEMIGPGIQGNPLKVKQVEVRVFDVYDIDKGRYLGLVDMECVLKQLEMPMVKIVLQSHFPEVYANYSDDELREMAKGSYFDGVYSTGIIREGIVIRPENTIMVDGKRLSFKVINLDYRD